MADSPFYHFNASFDALATIRRHAAGAQRPRPGFYLSYFGVAIDPAFFPGILDDWAGLVEQETVPANWHSDMAEFAAALRAVELAGDRFSMIELGCGWGCWMNLTGTVARRQGKDVSLIGVEADAAHIRFALKAMSDNGFDPGRFTLHRAVAAGRTGEALFPIQDESGANWALAPIFHSTPEQRDAAVADGSYEVLSMATLDTIASGEERIDLLHIDIQGGEADLVRDALPFLSERVAYLLIGTHGRAIEGKLFDLLEGAGWLLEIERPAIFELKEGRLALDVDGVQGWRNPALLPGG
jgi:FkbM family methyltransferase